MNGAGWSEAFHGVDRAACFCGSESEGDGTCVAAADVFGEVAVEAGELCKEFASSGIPDGELRVNETEVDFCRLVDEAGVAFHGSGAASGEVVGDVFICGS